ncbi:hypothetical protein [Roseovarius aestuariivivens]|uniref:hypothetical protein n=1 Tax=Roseovarius aestuariivivens TaxID=1888910 RepID=UPI001080DDDF|nr:hypothetical protein [Roseovarius aestuariivivens]
MQVVIHAGAHLTDEDRLVNCLVRNTDLLASIGTDVPNPQAYRKLLRDILHEALESGITSEARDVFLAAVGHDPSSDRLVLSNQGFFGTPKMAVGQGQIYPAAERRLTAAQQLFPRDNIELFLGLRNPASLLPALFDKTPHKRMDDYLNGVPPLDFRWSPTIARIRHAFPDMPITVWCNEDTPLIWAQVVRELAGLDPTASFEGEFTLLREIMTPAGMKRFEAYLESHPGMTEVQKRRVIAAFLDKFILDEEIEEELDLPGWTEELVDQMTEAYDEDLFEVQRVPGVNMIAP